MAAPQEQSGRASIAATAAILVLAGWLSAPALAAPDRGTLCHKEHEASLEIRTDTVSATIEVVADDHLLKPRVAAAAREVFADNDSDTEKEDAVESEPEEDEATTPRLRPLSDNELVPFRRQMYRRDI